VFQHEGLPDRDVGQVDFTHTRELVVRWKTER